MAFGGLVVLVEGRYRTQVQPAGQVACLERRGISVTVVEPEDPDATAHVRGARAVIARGRSAALLATVRAAEAAGVPTVNRAAAIEAVRDKGAMAVALASADIPTPPAWTGVPAELASVLPPATYPVVVKPVYGDNGRGIEVAADAERLRRLAWAEPVALVQPFVANEGYDLKLYAAGERVWAVRAASPFGPPSPPQPAPLTDGLAELAHACGERFGLELFGVDCVMTNDGPVVIEVNDFPNYRGVPEADEVLADYADEMGRRA